MERAIIKSEDGKQYFFYDDPEWGVDYKKNEVEGVLDIKEKVGLYPEYHWYQDSNANVAVYMRC